MPIKTAKREQLLDAGLCLLMTKPPDKISMDEVAAKAGVTKPMVYYYFGSKLGYYKQLVDYTVEFMQEMLANCDKPGISLKELMKNIVESRIEQTAARPELSNAVRIMVTSKTVGGAESRSKIVPVFAKVKPVFQQAIARGEIRKDADLELTMALVNSLLDGAVRMHGGNFFSIVSPRDFADKLIQLVFDGIGTGKRAPK